jgi:hypothetical protein
MRIVAAVTVRTKTVQSMLPVKRNWENIQARRRVKPGMTRWSSQDFFSSS